MVNAWSLLLGTAAAAALTLVWYSRRRVVSRARGHALDHGRTIASVNCLSEANASKAAEELIAAILVGRVTTVSECILFLRCQTPIEVVSGGKFKTKKQLSCSRLVALPESLLAEISATREKCIGPIGTALAGDAKALRLVENLLVANRMLATLEERRRTEFSNEDPKHEMLLRDIWATAFGSNVPFERPSDKWSELGFQGTDPVTDLRGGGMLALDCLAELCKTDPALLHRMMEFNRKQHAAKSDSWYLPAVVSIQFSVQLLVPQHVVSSMTPNFIYQKAHLDCLFNESRCFDGQGYFTLHHRMMLRFADMWEKELPHVMEYNNWIPRMYESFFQ